MVSMMATLHLLGVIIWIGGMFFAHMALRPAAAELLQPQQRLPLLKGVLDRFFRWVWLAILSLLFSGYWLFLVAFKGQAAPYVHLMQGAGLLMVIIFCYIYFAPYRRMGAALDRTDIPTAAAHMASIRRLIGVNLVLGLATAVIGAAKAF